MSASDGRIRPFISTIVGLAAIFVGAALIMWMLGVTPPVELTQPTVATVFAALTPLYLYSLVVERALEVFVSAWRQGPEDAVTTATYKADTKRFALYGGVGVGLALSLVGVRSLEVFVEPAAIQRWTQGQEAAFRFADVFITGALLGGGADGLHRIVSVFTDFADATRDRISAGRNPGGEVTHAQGGQHAQ